MDSKVFTTTAKVVLIKQLVILVVGKLDNNKKHIKTKAGQEKVIIYKVL